MWADPLQPIFMCWPPRQGGLGRACSFDSSRWSCLVWLSMELIVCSFESYMAEAIIGAFQSWHLESPLVNSIILSLYLFGRGFQVI